MKECSNCRKSYDSFLPVLWWTAIQETMKGADERFFCSLVCLKDWSIKECGSNDLVAKNR